MGMMDQLTLLFFVVFGGMGKDLPQAIAVDGKGQAIVAGTSASDNFPTSEGAPQPKPKARAWTPILTKLSPGGEQRLYSTYLGGSGHSYGASVATDVEGNVCLAGATASDNFPVTAGAAQTKFGGSGGRRGAGDAYVAKFDPDGKLIYASYFGGSSDDGATAVAISEAGECIIGGFTTSGDLPATPKSAYPKRPPGTLSGFLAVLSPDGASLTYATFMPHDVSVMKLISDGATFVAGRDHLSKIAHNGKREAWSVAISRNEGDWTRALSLDGPDHLRIVSESAKGGKGTILRVRTSDGTIAGSIPFGETAPTTIHSLVVDSAGQLWIAGSTGQPEEAFVAVLDSDGKQLQHRNAGPQAEQRVRALTLDSQGAALAIGESDEDIFLWKLALRRRPQ